MVVAGVGRGGRLDGVTSGEHCIYVRYELSLLRPVDWPTRARPSPALLRR